MRRQKQAVVFTVNSLNAFVEAYNQQIKRGNDFIYTYIAQEFSSYPDSMNPIKVFQLGNGPEEDKLGNQMKRAFKKLQETGQTPSRQIVRRFLRRLVRSFERQLEIIDFSVEMLRASESDKLDQFKRNQKIMHDNVNNFYEKALKPHRYAYQVYSKVPLSRGTVKTLQQNMLARFNAFSRSLNQLNKLGLGFNATRARDIIKNRIQRINKAGRYQHLRRILRVARYIMVKINMRIVEKDLGKNEAVLEHYHKAANRLFRANDSRSVRCYALWALKRRHLHIHPFEQNIVSKAVNVNKWNSDSINRVVDALQSIQEGETEHAFRHIRKQRADVNEYIDSVFSVTGELGKKNWAQHQAGEEVTPSVGRFYVKFYTRMGNWRFALRNIAF